MAVLPGSRIGAYDVTNQIGAGGMGQVFRATDTKLHRDVALKVLPPLVAADPERLARFRREAQLLASLNHPNIAHVYGLEETTDVLAIAMELVDGPTLAEMMTPPAPAKPAALPLAEAIQIARQIAEALEFAHDNGIVHRDLKPANIKVRPDGTVKVLDFGLAKALGGGDASHPGSGGTMNSPTLTARSTQLGVILGTAAYMSPEQAKGKPVDRRADIWAFGVILFEMLSGRRGYQAEDISETLAAVLTRDVEWSALPSATPPRLVALIRDCLSRDPKQRLRDIGEARRVLDQLSGGAPDTSVFASASALAPAPVATVRHRRALPWLVAAAAWLFAIAALWFGMRLARIAQPTAVVTRARAELTDLSGFVALSRDGTRLAYTVTGGPQGFYIALRRMDQFEGQKVAGAEGGLFPVFSPGGDWLVFSSRTSPTVIKKVPVAGGAAMTICDGDFSNGAAWGDDDTIVFPSPRGLMRVSANGGTPQTLTTLDAARKELSHTRPQFLPDGTHLLFTITTAADGPQFAVLDLRKGGQRIVARGGDNGRYVPTGHLTYVHDGTLFAVPFDLDSMATTGAVAPVVEQVSSIGPTGTGDYAFSETGLLAYSESGAKEGTLLTWIDRKGTLQPIPGQVARQWGTGRLSPDGLHVADGILGDKGSDIWVLDLARGTPTRLTFDANADVPTWTPDGKHVVYGARGKDGKPGIFRVAADGSGSPELVTAMDSPVAPTSFTPDGQTMILTQAVSGRARIMVMPPASGGAPRQTHPLHDTAAAESDAAISPDGKWIAFMSLETGSQEIYVLPFPGPGPKTRISTQGGRAPRWTRNGRELVFWAPSPGTSSMLSVTMTPGPTLVPGAPVELFKYFSGTTWDVAQDGNRFLVETVGTGTGSTFVTVTNWFDELTRRAPIKK